MKIDPLFLSGFVGGTMYFRFANLGTGPDMYHLFRHGIVATELNESGLYLAVEDPELNRFLHGEWVSHPTGECVLDYPFKSIPLESNTVPTFIVLRHDVLYVRTDSLGEGILYAPGTPEPDIMFVFRDFPRGYEQIFGLGQIAE